MNSTDYSVQFTYDGHLFLLLALPPPLDALRPVHQRGVELEPTTKTGQAVDQKKDRLRQKPEKRKRQIKQIQIINP